MTNDINSVDSDPKRLIRLIYVKTNNSINSINDNNAINLYPKRLIAIIAVD